jgi:glutathione S-transferase
MTFAEKNVTPEMTTVDVFAGAQKSPEHMKHQPFGQIPVLQDGDFEMFESRAIIRYLDSQLSSGAKLTPSDAKLHAKMEQWISVESANFTPSAMAYIYQYMFIPMRGGKTDESVVAAAKPKLEACCDILDKNLADKQFLCGDMFTLADIGFMPYLEYLMQTPGKEIVAARPNMMKWWERISSRPSWKKAIGQA